MARRSARLGNSRAKYVGIKPDRAPWACDNGAHNPRPEGAHTPPQGRRRTTASDDVCRGRKWPALAVAAVAGRPKLSRSNAKKAIALRATFRAEAGAATGLTRLLEKLPPPHLFLDAAALDQFPEAANSFLNALPFTNRELDHTNPDELEIPGTKLQRVAKGGRKVHPALRPGHSRASCFRNWPPKQRWPWPSAGFGESLDCPFLAPAAQLGPAGIHHQRVPSGGSRGHVHRSLPPPFFMLPPWPCREPGGRRNR